MGAKLIGKRYARGLFQGLDEDLKKIKQASEYLAQLSNLFKQDKFKKVLNSPVVKGEVKLEVLTQGLSADSDKVLTQFMKTLVDAGRVPAIPAINESLSEMIKEKDGVKEADLITAVEIGAEYKDKITEILKEKLGYKVQLTPKVDKSILGGFVVKFAHSEFDMSLRKKLDVFVQEATS